MDNINKAFICCEPLFALLRHFFDDSHGKDVVLDFREAISAEFVELERKAYSLQIDPLIIIDIKYAMAAFVDECVMYSEWAPRLEWMGRPLQLQFFGEHIAGENFFKKLSELRQAGISKIDLLEIYYICLKLGFKGMYRIKGEEILISLQAGLRSQIETMRGHEDASLDKIALPQENFVKHVSRTVPFWIIALLSTCLIFLIYGAYSIAIESQAHKAVGEIQNV